VNSVTRWLRSERRSLIVVSWLTVLVLAVALPVWPGVFTVDSLTILGQGVANEVTNWYSPIHGWFWGRIDALGAPVALMLVLGVSAFVLGSYFFLRLWLGQFASLIAVSFIVLWPPVYGLLGWVGRDIWFTAYLMLSFALAGRALRGVHPRLTGGAAIGLAILAVDTRQNAFPVLVAAVAMVAFALARHHDLRSALLRASAVVAVGLVGVVALLGLQRLVTSHQHFPSEHLYLSDLIALSVLRDEMLLPPDLFPSQSVAVAREAMHPGRILYLGEQVAQEDGTVRLEGEIAYLDTSPAGEELNARYAKLWRDAILSDLPGYLTIRYDRYLEQLALSGGAQDPYYGVTDALDWGASEELREQMYRYYSVTDELSRQRSGQLQQTFTGLNEVRLQYLEAARSSTGDGSLLHAVWIYLLLGLGASAVLAWKGTELRALGFAALGFLMLMQAVLFVFAPVATFRYQYPTVVFGMLMTVAAGAVLLHSRHVDRSTEAALDVETLVPPKTDRERGTTSSTAFRHWGWWPSPARS